MLWVRPSRLALDGLRDAFSRCAGSHLRMRSVVPSRRDSETSQVLGRRCTTSLILRCEPRNTLKSWQKVTRASLEGRTQPPRKTLFAFILLTQAAAPLGQARRRRYVALHDLVIARHERGLCATCRSSVGFHHRSNGELCPDFCKPAKFSGLDLTAPLGVPNAYGVPPLRHGLRPIHLSPASRGRGTPSRKGIGAAKR